MDLSLSLFASCCHLESLTLIRVLFVNIRPETLSGSLFPSLRRLRILGPWSDDDDKTFGIIMTHAAPTLTTLILSGTNARFFMNFNSTIIFPALESIQATCKMYQYDNNPVLTFLSRCLKHHSTPMLAQIQIEVFCDYGDNIDEILSSHPRYRALKDTLFSPTGTYWKFRRLSIRFFQLCRLEVSL
ncbi:hypothetical protein BYT27DRAFT_7185571, partial [Phlegmacium glaucopus]